MTQDIQNDLPPNLSDHDLLIVLHTTMRHMSRDIATIKDDNTQRLAVLEATKFDKEDAAKAMHDAEKIHQKLSDRIDAKQSISDALEVKKQFEKVNDDHETRMRSIERKIYLATGALAILQILIGIVK